MCMNEFKYAIFVCFAWNVVCGGIEENPFLWGIFGEGSRYFFPPPLTFVFLDESLKKSLLKK